MNILVTGANGQLGRMIAKVSSDSSNNYFFTDLQLDYEAGILPLSITDHDAVDAFVVENNIDVIVNCASYTAVDQAENDPDAADLINNRAVASLAGIALERNSLLIHISSDYVFDGTASRPYTEDAPTSPLSVYGRTKADSERAVLESGCRHIIFRTSWLYCTEGKNFVKRILEKGAQMPQLKVISDQIGSPTHAEDLAWLICHVIEEDMLDRTGLYNYSNEGVSSWYDFAHEICSQAGYTCDVQPCHTDEYPRVAMRPHYSVLDKTKVKETFGVEIPHWKDALRLCMHEMSEN